MNIERQTFIVKGSNPPTVEVDSAAKAVYVRFTHAAVAKTVPQESEHSHIAIDIDKNGEIIGFEAVGISRFSIAELLQMASVEAPNLDLARAEYSPTDCVPA